jgi:glycosyltransferase involved in cell wall biosynthesis
MKVLMVGDSPLITTGFGRVQRHALEAFLLQGWEVAAVTALQMEEKQTDLPLKQYVPTAGDSLGLVKVEEAVAEFEPDVIYMTGEPGSVTGYAHVLPARIPFLAYVPIEGEPIVHGDWRGILKTINWFTCSRYGQAVAKRDLGKDVDFVYHGVDADVFKVDDEARERTRKQLGWTDKFVVMTVAANVRRKQHPRLFEAIALLHKQFKQRDVILYDHTVPYQRHWLEGWHLPQIADAMGIHDKVQFNPSLTGFGASAPELGTAELPGLADLYRAADLFVLPSQVEGFGLPIAEAMASGTPVLVTKYAAGWEVASPAGAGIPIHDWETAKNGTRLANVSPLDLAKSILSLRRDPKRLVRMRAAGIERAKDFTWGAFKEYVVAAVQEAQAAGGLPEGEAAAA